MCDDAGLVLADPSTVADEIELDDDLYFFEVRASVDTSSYGLYFDLTLSSPSGTTVLLHGQNAYFAGGSGFETVAITYSDEGAPYGSVPLSCDCSMQPLEALTAFESESSLGLWTLEFVGIDGGASPGTLNEWCLEVEGCELPADDCDGDLLPDACQVARARIAATLAGSTTSPEAAAGTSVALLGDVALVGSPLDPSSGEGYVFRRDVATGEWNEEQRLSSSALGAGDRFGSAVALADGSALVAAPFANDAGTNSGVVYAFRWDATAGEWTQEQRFTASDATAGYQFGSALSMYQEIAIAGAPLDDELGSNAGAAYVFRFDGRLWIEEQKLTASDAAAFENFGYSVAVRGCLAVIGSPGDDGAGSEAGAAYVFQLDDSTGDWNEVVKLTASNASAFDEFGYAVATDGERALVGAPFANLGNAGAAYGYEYDSKAEIWVEQKIASDADQGAELGCAVSIDGTLAAVGSRGRNSERGAVHLYSRSGDGWVARETLTLLRAPEDDRLGESVALALPYLVAGAGGYDGAGANAGTAILYHLEDCNSNGAVDRCEIAARTSEDANGNGVPDESEGSFDCRLGDGGKGEPRFLRGDCDGNGNVHSLVDGLFLLLWQFAGGPAPGCMYAADVDGNNNVHALVDTLVLLVWQFSSGPAPPAPGPTRCGADEDGDLELGCLTPPAFCN